jgi:hypothetical protein
MKTGTEKTHAHDLLDRLEPGQLAAVIHLLETIVAPGEETLSEHDRRAIAEADQWLEHNDPIPHQEILAELGLTMADWEEMSAELGKSPGKGG